MILNGRAGTAGYQANRLRENYAHRSLKKASILLLPVLLLILFASGCAGSLGKTSVQTTQSASFQLTPGTLKFGTVPIGKQTAQTISMVNPTRYTLNITQAALSNAQFVMSGMTVPMPLAPGQTKNFSVAVNPAAVGDVHGTLTVQGDSGSSPIVVDLSATGMTPQPKISLSTNAVDFGTVGIGSQGSASIIVSNAGGSDLTISVISMNGAGFTASGLTTPKTISAGQAATLGLSFRPTAVGADLGTIAISSNDPAAPSASISLTGTGSAAPVGQLSSSPASLSFDNVAAGSSTTQQLTLSNTGNGPTQISSVSITGTGFSVSGITAPSTLNASQTLPLTVKFNPATAGTVTGILTVVSNANGSPLKIALNGSAVQAGLSVTPSTFDFGSVVDGQTKSQAIILTNTGTAALTIAQLSVNGAAYTLSGLNTPATLAPGKNTSVNVLFAPKTAGSLPGGLSIASNAPTSPTAVSFAGTGVAASVTMTPSPASVSFGSISAGSSASQNVTLTNNGNSAVTISQVSVSAKDVKVSGITMPLTLNAGQKAAMTLTFTPASSETVTGSVSVSSSQGASTVVPLSGSAVQPMLSVTPATVSFGSLSTGATNSQTIQVSNSGTGTLTISQVSVAGSGFGTGSLNLPIVLGAGQSSTFNLQFSPTSAGSVSGSASIISNAPNSPSAIALSGAGIASTQTLSFSTRSLSFGSVNDGGSSTQSVSLSNTGNSNVTISQISLTGSSFALSGASTPVTLAPSQSLTLGVLFSPTTAGNLIGAITVVSNATGSPATITLSGTGVANVSHSVLLTWTASTSSVSGYNVYRSSTSGSGYVRVNGGLVASVNFTDSPVQNATTYYYVTTAVDSGGNESSYSNEAQASIP
ncbi:MAG TPA: choice-of-anchor D domain-containing protein [Candidatus Acidoferrum sp.]